MRSAGREPTIHGLKTIVLLTTLQRSLLGIDKNICFIGVGRFRVLGGPRFRILGGGQGGPNSQQAHGVVMTSMRRNDVASISFRRHVPTRFLINQCQIITFLILKSDIIENSRIELRGIVLPVPSNQIKVTFIIILPFNLIRLCFFSCFT